MSAAKSKAPGWHLPRASSPAAGSGAGGAGGAIGIGAFAFQGTNAQALLQQAGVAAATQPTMALALLRQQRFWVAPPVHILLQTAAATAGSRFARRAAAAAVALESSLAAPQLAFLWQHSVLGRPIFPATAFLEMASGATRQVLNSSELSGWSLRGAVFATPLLLPPPAAAAGVRMRCLVQATAGGFEVGSAGAGAQIRTHFYAALTYMAATTTARPAAASQPAAAAALLLHSSAPAATARLAVGEMALPREQFGTGVHPAVSEAGMHVAVAHQQQTGSLRIAARIAAVHVPLPPAQPETHLWASCLVAAAPGTAGASSRQQEQWLVGSGGVTMRLAGMETRRLMAQVGIGSRVWGSAFSAGHACCARRLVVQRFVGSRGVNPCPAPPLRLPPCSAQRP